MAILSKDEAQALLKKVLTYSTADECTVGLDGRSTGNIRYARNSVSTAGASDTVSLSVESRFGKRSGIASLTRLRYAAACSGPRKLRVSPPRAPSTCPS
jgi:hypothetical protein